MTKKLVVAGSGIQYLSHLTHETKINIQDASLVLFLVNEPMIKDWILKNSQASEDLDSLYRSSEDRNTVYTAIENYILSALNNIDNLCVVFYGHPCMCAKPALNAAKRASKKGIKVKVLPAISAEACLYADLHINPLEHGLYSLEASTLLNKQKLIDTSTNLLIWQVSHINQTGHYKKPNIIGIQSLQSYLMNYYPESKQCIIYEASLYSHFLPAIQSLPLNNIEKAVYSPLSSLFIPADNISFSKENII